jgi:hypothetical protein
MSHIFVIFNWLSPFWVLPILGPVWNDDARKLSFVALLWSPTKNICDNMLRIHIFFAKKKSIVSCSALKCKYKPTPLLTKSVGACTECRKYLWRFAHRNEGWSVHRNCSIIYLGHCAKLLKRCLVPASQKKLDFGTSKIENIFFPQRKHTFREMKRKNGLRGIACSPKSYTRVWYDIVSVNYVMIRVII